MSCTVRSLTAFPRETHWAIIEQLPLKDACQLAKTCSFAREAFYSYFNLEAGDHNTLELWSKTFSPSIMKNFKKRLFCHSSCEEDFKLILCCDVKELVAHPERIRLMCDSLRLYPATKLAKKCIDEGNRVVFQELLKKEISPSMLVNLFLRLCQRYESENPYFIIEFIHSESFEKIPAVNGPTFHIRNSLGLILASLVEKKEMKFLEIIDLLLATPKAGELSHEYLMKIFENAINVCNREAIKLLNQKFGSVITTENWIRFAQVMRYRVTADLMSRREFYSMIHFFDQIMTHHQRTQFYENLPLDFRCHFWNVEAL